MVSNTDYEPDLRRTLSPQDLYYMVCHLVRVTELFRMYEDFLKPTMFHFESDPTPEDFFEYAFMCVTEGLRLYYSEQKASSPPDRPMLEQYIRFYIRTGIPFPEDWESAMYGDDDETPGICQGIYSDETKSYNLNSGIPLVKQFLVERGVIGNLASTFQRLQTIGGTVDMQASTCIKELSEYTQRVSAAGARIDIESVFPDADFFSRQKEIKLWSTGNIYLDAGLGGGVRPGEVNGLFGPTGAGKSTLAGTIMVDMAKEIASDCLLLDAPDAFCAYFTYEQCATELYPRIWSHALSIWEPSLSIMTGLVDPSTPGNPKPYEVELWPGQKTSEVERWEEGRSVLGNRLVIRNMSGVPDSGDSDKIAELKRHAGRGGVQEIVQDLKRIQDDFQKPVRSVVIDYAGLVCERYIGSSGDDRQVYRAIKNITDELRHYVAGEFSCVVWLLHQMSGVANSYSPIKPLHHSDAEGCKSIANNMANCLCLGNPAICTEDNGENQCLFLNFSKTRNAARNDMRTKCPILQRDKYFWRFNDATERFDPCPATKCFIKR